MNEPEPTAPAAAGAVRVRVWDVPTRLAHWLVVALCGFSWWSYKNYRMDLHVLSGYALLGVVLFRIYWGVFGPSTVRFSSFVRGPAVVWNYLRGRWAVTPGHNPLGALSVLVLLLLLVAQVTLGLFAVDTDGIESGPLSLYVSFETGRRAAGLHGLTFKLLQIFVVVHLVAVLYYVLFKRENLVAAMVHGSRAYVGQPAGAVTFATWPRFLVGVALSAALTFAIAKAFRF